MDKQMSIRLIQNSQWGFVDHIYCTEGKNIRILKNVSMTAVM